MRIINLIESIEGKINQIQSFLVVDEKLAAEVQAKVETKFIEAINDHTSPAILSTESEQYWLEKGHYTNKNYQLQIVSSYTAQ